MKRKEKLNFRELPRPVTTVPADPTQWSETSRQSIAGIFRREYRDIEYRCKKCRVIAVFSASQQKHAFEVKKTYIEQTRTLCEACYIESNRVADDISACEAQWAQSKNVLQRDAGFLLTWLHLLEERELYVCRRANTAVKNMLKKLLDELIPNQETTAALKTTLELE